MGNEVLISKLREYAEWAEGFCWDVPIDLPETLKAAAGLLEKLTDPTGIDELGLSTRAYSALYRRGFRLLREIKNMSVDDLAKIPGIGVGTAKEIMEKIKEVYGR